MLKMIVAIAIGALGFAPVDGFAATVVYDDYGRAQGVSSLEIDGAIYQIEFRYTWYANAFPNGEIFPNAEDIAAEIGAVLEAEPSIPLIGGVFEYLNCSFLGCEDWVQASIGFVIPTSPTVSHVTRCSTYQYGTVGPHPLTYSGGNPLNDGGECQSGYDEADTVGLNVDSETLFAVATGGPFELGGPTWLPGCGPSGGVPPKCNSPSVVPVPASIFFMLAGFGILSQAARFRNRA